MLSTYSPFPRQSQPFSTKATNLQSSTLFYPLLPPAPARQPLPASMHSGTAELAGCFLWSKPMPGDQGGSHIRQPAAPALPPPQHSPHSLPKCGELALCAAHLRLPVPSPTLLTGTGHGCGLGKLPPTQTQAPCELLLAVWLKILREVVLGDRWLSHKRKARESI